MNQVEIKQFAKNLILENKGKKNFPSLSQVFLDKPKMVLGLIDLLDEKNGYPFPEYSSWLITHIARKDFKILIPHYNLLVDHILASKNESVSRNLLGAINCITLKEYQESALLDKLIGWVSNPNTKPAIVMYALEKLSQFCIKYPEIKIEIIAILSLKDNHELGPAIKVAKRKFIYGK